MLPNINLILIGVLISSTIDCFIFTTLKPTERVVVKEKIVHDTIRVQAPAVLDPTLIEPLLIQYYKQGWMNATNNLIDLYNEGDFTDHRVASERRKAFSKPIIRRNYE